MAGLRPGDVIAGKFRVERVLGEGGMGYVVAARHLQLGQMVALKFMRDEVSNKDYRSRFLREARNTVRLKSKHVSRVLDVGTLDSGAPYMVMEYLEGVDLSNLLHRRGPVPVQEACEYVLQACEAIAEAHGHGIVHRDLKPANLFLTKGPNGEPVVKVLDFGVSKIVDLGVEDETSKGGGGRGHPDSVVTKATDLLGSPSYMAPEQIVSASDADIGSDVWSLGVILFRLISGKAPFHATSLGELIQGIVHGPTPSLREAKPDLPEGLEHVVARCLERDRAARLRDVGELARMLAPYAGPVAAPSLERIALLGPALVSAPPPPPLPSAPSFTSSAGTAWTNVPSRAVTASAPSARAETASVPASRRGSPKKELSAVSAALWGVLFVVVVALAFVFVAKRARQRAAVHPPVTAVSAEPSPSSDPLPAADVTPPNLDIPPAPTAAEAASAPAVSRAAASASARPRPRVASPPRAADSKPAASVAPGPEIPATRE